ncbi:TetR/AcrR family transcriptional regulator [Pseudonocardia sp. GCM10023141]|uniref:TetR/AcrR family transcriptional regulator n=1 Tax=Pseudonocardia sp. GCM10023141 TaxID=3252653 RepID=UPI003605BE41
MEAARPVSDNGVMMDSQKAILEVGAAAAASRGGRPRDPALDDAIITATRRRLVLDGYSKMTIGEIASDAGVSRPTIYRRWPGKLELTIDALDYGLRAQRDTFPNLRLEELPALEAFTEAVRRVDPRYFNPDAMVLMGNFMGETIRTPELLAVVFEYAVEPRVKLVERVLADLQRRGDVRADIDIHTIATMCFGSYYAAFLRAEHDRNVLAEQVVAVLWPGIAAQ